MMPIDKFVKIGGLQEVNREWMHPRGMALVVGIGENGKYTLEGIADARDDPEGICFVAPPAAQKAEEPERLRAEKAEARMHTLGYKIQPTAKGKP